MRCKCLSETFPSNLNNYKLYKLLKSQGSKKSVFATVGNNIVETLSSG